MMQNRAVKIQKEYRKLYLRKLNTFEADYDSILNKYLGKVRKIVFDHSDSSGNLQRSSQKTVKRSLRILDNWLRIETEDIISRYILEAIKISLLGQVKVLNWYYKYRGKGKNNLPLIKNKYNKERIMEISEKVLNKKWSDGLKISDRLDKLSNSNNKKINNILSKNINENDTAVSLLHDVSHRIHNPVGSSYKFRVLRIARTETNSAYQLIQKLIASDADLVKGIKWNLSPSHPNYEHYEVCERYAQEDHAGLGAGVYKPENLPDVPHPECLCYLIFLF